MSSIVDLMAPHEAHDMRYIHDGFIGYMARIKLLRCLTEH